MKFLMLLFLFLYFFIFPTNTYAVAIQITDFPQKVEGEFGVKINVSGAKAGTNYFCLTLKKDDKNVVGLSTWNGSEWYTGSNGKSCFSYVVSSKSDGIEIKGKLNEETDIQTGDYELSVRRYTQSGSFAANDSVNEVNVSVVKEEKKTPQPKEDKPTLAPTPTIVRKETEIPTPIIVVAQNDLKTLTPEIVLGASDEPEKTNIQNSKNQNLISYYPYVLIVLGLAIIFLGGFVFWREGGFIDILNE